MDGSTGALSGTPTAGGSWAWTVRVEDSVGGRYDLNDSAQMEAIDPDFSSVTSLLHFDGADGSTTFTDQISRVWTPYIGTTISTEESKFGGGSMRLARAGTSILCPYSNGLYLSGDFTIETFLYLKSYGGMVFCMGGGSGIAWASYELSFDAHNLNFAGSSSNAGYDIGSEAGSVGSLGAVPLNTWMHVAIARQGNIYRGFVDGVNTYTQTIAKDPYNASPRGLCVGANYAGTWGSGTPTNSIDGFIDEFRITKGVARYTADFTPPTAAFPNS